ncbi:MAG TPA: hypothetical protein VIC54_05740 [Terriglobales bacterium]|jgi:hypothetical protein
MRNPEYWQRELQYAAVGITAAVLVEVGASASSGATSDDRSHRARRWGWLLLAGGVATAYAHLVPKGNWGLRSGAAFAQLPLVLSLHERLGTASSVKLAAWGALTGLALHVLPVPAPARPLPRR